MNQRICQVTLLVRDYDEAIHYFVTVLGFELWQDTTVNAEKRWVVVTPPGNRGAALLLAKAVGPQQEAAVGKQAGGRVAFFLETDDFDADYAILSASGVKFAERPRQEIYGTVAVFTDLYGNRWDLIQPAAPPER